MSCGNNGNSRRSSSGGSGCRSAVTLAIGNSLRGSGFISKTVLVAAVSNSVEEVLIGTETRRVCSFTSEFASLAQHVRDTFLSALGKSRGLRGDQGRQSDGGSEKDEQHLEG